MPQMVWTTTPRGSHSYFNKLWYEYTGLEPEQSLGLGWQSPFHEGEFCKLISWPKRSLIRLSLGLQMICQQR
jgi:PAS domain-containing protein